MNELADLIQTTVAPDTWGPPGGAAIGPAGPAAVPGFVAPAPGGGAANLVDLIKRNVAPETWDIQGGPGTIGVFHH